MRKHTLSSEDRQELALVLARLEATVGGAMYETPGFLGKLIVDELLGFSVVQASQVMERLGGLVHRNDVQPGFMWFDETLRSLVTDEARRSYKKLAHPMDKSKQRLVRALVRSIYLGTDGKRSFCHTDPAVLDIAKNFVGVGIGTAADPAAAFEQVLEVFALYDQRIMRQPGGNFGIVTVEPEWDLTLRVTRGEANRLAQAAALLPPQPVAIQAQPPSVQKPVATPEPAPQKPPPGATLPAVQPPVQLTSKIGVNSCLSYLWNVRARAIYLEFDGGPFTSSHADRARYIGDGKMLKKPSDWANARTQLSAAGMITSSSVYSYGPLGSYTKYEFIDAKVPQEWKNALAEKKVAVQTASAEVAVEEVSELKDHIAEDPGVDHDDGVDADGAEGRHDEVASEHEVEEKAKELEPESNETSDTTSVEDINAVDAPEPSDTVTEEEVVTGQQEDPLPSDPPDAQVCDEETALQARLVLATEQLHRDEEDCVRVQRALEEEDGKVAEKQTLVDQCQEAWAVAEQELRDANVRRKDTHDTLRNREAAVSQGRLAVAEIMVVRAIAVLRKLGLSKEQVDDIAKRF